MEGSRPGRYVKFDSRVGTHGGFNHRRRCEGGNPPGDQDMVDSSHPHLGGTIPGDDEKVVFSGQRVPLKFGSSGLEISHK